MRDVNHLRDKKMTKVKHFRTKFEQLPVNSQAVGIVVCLLLIISILTEIVLIPAGVYCR